MSVTIVDRATVYCAGCRSNISYQAHDVDVMLREASVFAVSRHGMGSTSEAIVDRVIKCPCGNTIKVG